MSHIKAYEDYFRNIATIFAPIGHSEEQARFASLSQDEVIAGVRKDLNLSEFCMTLLSFDLKLIKTNTRQYQSQFKVAFEIVKEKARNDLDEVSIKDEALALCEEIMAYIQNQAHARTFPLGELQDDIVEYYEINAAFDDCIGYGCEFKYIKPHNRSTTINPSHWTT